MKYEQYRFSLPGDRSSYGSPSPFRKGWFLLLLFMAAPAAGAISRMRALDDLPGTIFGCLFAVLAGFSLWYDLLTGSVSSRGRRYDRYDEPGRYWFGILFWIICYGVGIWFLFYAEPPLAQIQ